MVLFCKEKEKETMKPCFVKWLRAAGIRAMKAVVQTAVAAISTAAVLAEVGWLMDVDDHYGFVKTADVRTAASFVQLDWRMESSDQ